MMVSILGGLTLALAGLATAASLIVPENDVPSWASDSTMQLSLSSNKGSILPVDYNIVPLTQNLGLNGSEVVRGAIKLEGIMFAATQTTYNMSGLSNLIAYMSCDASTDANAASPDDMLIRLMEAEPRAIVLYSTVGNWCMLTTSDVPYATLFTMADAGDATQADEVLKNTNELGVIQVTITGNTSTDGRNPSEGTTSHSAVAMTILYTITGLITLLFLAIIGTGAVRAHRHPERYGPRASYGGRPPQSRARGLARAVLETLPIVKFGNPDPPKPDPNYELESGSIQQTDGTLAPGAQPAPSGRPSVDANDATSQSRDLTAAREPTSASAVSGAVGSGPQEDDEHLGCTICTEDFNVGEDVRVLPCDHKFHPNCIDPWLVNVSGTCPLCRLDLRPRREDGTLDESSDGESLAPPLGSDGQDSDSGSQRRRASRLLDLGRLRHASAEERILALRQYRTEQRTRDQPRSDDDTEAASMSDQDTGRRRVKLSDRLRDKFRVRTRPQGADSDMRGDNV
ncbi:RING-7 protein [Plectosphaerella plurivora]|uniref:RING-type E3 ubiquitin transferase n=1 Tax=Plectosphaerella plurivora TaxID=936078 RepID=A0A9P8VE90_9PEZI|nr:RING-7 protein [Plectosphaerella plurivora]